MHCRVKNGFENYIRRKLLENVSNKPVGACYELPRELKSFSFESIKESLKDSAELKDIVLSYLENDFFDEQKAHFSDQYSGLLEKVGCVVVFTIMRMLLMIKGDFILQLTQQYKEHTIF